jgi:hypothetical protein
MLQLSLEAQVNTITLEAASGESSLQQALTRLPMFLKTTTTKLVDALKHPIDSFFPAKNLTWAAEQLSATPYPQMRGVTVPCVPGIKSDYLAYTNQLADDALFCRAMEQNYLDPLIDYLSRKLNNPNGLRSVQPDDSLNHITMDALNHHNQALGKHLDARDDKNTKPYGKVVKNNASWAQIIANCETIHRAFAAADHDRFKSKVDRANELLGTLIQRLTHDKELYRVSGPVLTAVVNAAYVTATAVEYYGLTYRRGLVLDFAIDQLIVQVKKKAA